MSVPVSWWIYFNLLVALMLVLDLFVLHRKAHVISLKEATWLSIFWVVLALAFNVALYFWWPDPTPGAASKASWDFFAGYLIERALSVDNIFVFVVLFRYFRVPSKHHHGVLFWGIIGAMIFRAIFIFAGVKIIEMFHWAIYVFGVFLIGTGIKMAFAHGSEIHPERNPVLRMIRRWVPVTPDYVGGKFFTKVDRRIFATPLLIVLMMVETTDLVFAVDSIPAILAITHDPFLVYSSNIFAIFGLRALYFLLAGAMDLFHYLSYGLAAVLVFVGIKMLLPGISEAYKLETKPALLVVVIILTVSIAASLMFPKKPEPMDDIIHDPDQEPAEGKQLPGRKPRAARQ